MAIRHQSPDIGVLAEIFGWHAYAPPLAVTALIEGLGRPLRVLDVGGHIGLFSAWVEGLWPVESSTIIEPNPEHLLQLRQTQCGLPVPGRWTIIDACAGTTEGTVHYDPRRWVTSDCAPDGANARLIDVLPLMSAVDLVKMDIEGAEWRILFDPRFPGASARVFVLELHRQGAPGPDFAAVAKERLAATGLSVLELAGSGPSSCVRVWAWRE